MAEKFISIMSVVDTGLKMGVYPQMANLIWTMMMNCWIFRQTRRISHGFISVELQWSSRGGTSSVQQKGSTSTHLVSH